MISEKYIKQLKTASINTIEHEEEIIPRNKKVLEIFTDGSCVLNTKEPDKTIAGYGVFFPNKEYISYGKRLDGKRTNQRAELQAIYSALKKIKKYMNKYNKIIIFSDSMYSINCYTSWCKKWESNRWKRQEGGTYKDVMNIDIIKPAYELLTELKKTKEIEFIHVNSHTKKEDYYSVCNDIVDMLAKKGSELENDEHIEIINNWSQAER